MNTSNLEKYNSYQALKLMENNIMATKRLASPIIFFTLKNDLVLIINDNLRVTYTKDVFINEFIDEEFFIYKKIEIITDDEIEYFYKRQ